MKARSDSASGLAVETFKYDALNRLTHKGSTATAFPAVLASYDAVGNLTSKLGQGAYVYDAASKRLASFGGNAYSYDGNGNVVADGVRTITYNAFNLPETITKTTGVNAGSTLAYSYDASHARVKESSPTHGSTYYAGGYELVIPADSTASAQKREERSYIATPEGTVGVITQLSTSNASGPPSRSTDTRYWHKDHLGSISAITNPSGTVLQRFRFDPWGVRECLSAAAVVTPCSSSSLQNGGSEERGFTGHEMLDEVGLIHMNGRLFDQTLGRFLQADPIIQEPLNSQNYNRYSYVFNNPLAYTDPSGFSAWTKVRAPLAAVAIMIITNGIGKEFAAAAYAEATAEALAGGLGPSAGVIGNAAAANVQMAFTIAGGAAAGAITGGNVESAVLGVFQAMASFGIGEFTGHGTLPVGSAAHFQNIVGHAALGCAMANAAGGSCKSGALAGGFSAAAGPVIAGLTEGNFGAGLAGRMAAGCVGSYIGKGSCEAGAVTAAFDYLFNHLATVGVSIKIPFIGGAKFSVGVSYEKSEWDAGLVIESDVLTASAGRMLGKAAVEAGYQTGDIRSNNASYTVDAAIGVIKGGASFQRDLKDDQISGGAISIGPQLGASVGAKKTATLSLRYDIVPPVTNVLNTVRNWWGK